MDEEITVCLGCKTRHSVGNGKSNGVECKNCGGNLITAFEPTDEEERCVQNPVLACIKRSCDRSKEYSLDDAEEVDVKCPICGSHLYYMDNKLSQSDIRILIEVSIEEFKPFEEGDIAPEINHEELMDLAITYFGYDDPHLGFLLNRLGYNLLKHDAVTEARNVLAEALLINEANFGSESLRVAIDASCFGSVLNRLGERHLAKILNKRAIGICAKNGLSKSHEIFRFVENNHRTSLLGTEVTDQEWGRLLQERICANELIPAEKEISTIGNSK